MLDTFQESGKVIELNERLINTRKASFITLGERQSRADDLPILISLTAVLLLNSNGKGSRGTPTVVVDLLASFSPH